MLSTDDIDELLHLEPEALKSALVVLNAKLKRDEERKRLAREKKARQRRDNKGTIEGHCRDSAGDTEGDIDNKEIPPTPPKEITTSLTLLPSSKPSEGKKPDTFARARSSSDDLSEAVEAWNALAHEISLPKVARLTQERRQKLASRLRDCGGIEGWNAALAKVRDSPFLTGGNRDGWRADFDFVLQAKSFTKLMEGAYDDRGKRNGFADNLDRAAAALGEQDRREGICGEGGEGPIRVFS